MSPSRPFKTWNHHIFTENDKLCCSVEYLESNRHASTMHGSACPKRLSTRHRLSSKTVWGGMSHAGRKPSTWQTSLLSLTHSCLEALKDSDVGLHGLSIWITLRPVYWSQFVFRYLLWLPPPFASLSPLWSDNTELNVMMQGHNTHACRFKYTQTSTKKIEKSKKVSQRDTY